MARHAYKSEKRRKETTRLKKQEEKRQRRFAAKTADDGSEIEAVGTEDTLEETGVARDEESAETKEEGLPQGA